MIISYSSSHTHLFFVSKIEAFIKKFATWTPSDGVLHPHPHIGATFKSVRLRRWRKSEEKAVWTRKRMRES